MHIIISRGPNAATTPKADFVRQLQYLPGMGPTKASELWGGTSIAITIAPEKVTVATNRLRSLLSQGLILTNIDIANPIGDAPMANPVPLINPPAPVVAPAIPAGTDIGAILGALVLPAVQQQIQTLVDEAVGAKVPREIIIKAADKPEVRMDGHVHPAFDKVLRLTKAGVLVMLVGPAGCGKTHLFSQVCKALGTEGESISLSGGVTEAHLTGRLLPTGAGGRFEYTESPFIKCYAGGKPFLLDEMDGGDPNVLLTLNQATANGGFHVEARAAGGLDTFVKRHPDTVLMATANTYGTGSGAMYVGRNQLDAATLDRWYVVQMDYDKAYEEKCAPSQVTHFVWRLRELITENKWRRVASTRMIQKAASALGAGLLWSEVKGDLLSGFTSDERAKINF
jgi:cobaltochelatase CobS